MRNKVSIIIPASLGNRGVKEKYMPMIKMLGDNLCSVYGIQFPRGYTVTDEPVHKFHLSRSIDLISRRIIAPASHLLAFPNYYAYLSKVEMVDRKYARAVSKDDSKIVFTSPLLNRTVKLAKSMGKTIVVEAGNSEPEREYRRISEEYERFGITQKYIYGDPRYKIRCKESFETADKIITISEVSRRTYAEAGYDMSKFKLISLAGTNFNINTSISNKGKQKAFISTAFHSFIKGTQRLLLGWREANITDVPLLIVGNLCEDIQEFIKKNGPFNNVQYIGNRSDLSEWYRQFDAVGIILSLSEGAGRVTPEMMSFGFPMITSQDASCDLVVNGKNGFIVDPFDERALTELLRSIDNNWEQIRALSKNAIESVNNRTLYDYSFDLYKFLEGLL